MMTLSLLPLLALAGNVTIDGVSAAAAGNKLTVEVKTSAPVETGDVRSKFVGGMMQLYLDGGHARGDRRTFKSGEFDASVLKRNGYVKVEVPLSAELECEGPVAVAAGESGFTASMRCAGLGNTIEEPVEEKVAAEPAHEAAPVKAAEKTTTPAPTVERTAEPSAPAAPAPKAEAKPEPVKVAEAPAAAVAAPPAAIATGSSPAMMMPAIVLIGLGVAAYYFKKRQTKKSSLIEILETAQIGPKRQLVVARVNGETMVLGSSEAGITCLTGMHRLPTMGSEGTMSSIFQVEPMQVAASQALPPPLPPRRDQFVPFDPAPAQGSGNEFVDEGGILTRLFRARGQEKPQGQEKFENIELHEFDNLLQESVADQDLRRKLSAGFRGKVS
jgi:flagellar biogenesis protein FliO